MSKTTEWLAVLHEPPFYWFKLRCLRMHYHVPKTATEVRFVRGENADALHHRIDDLEIHVVTGHRDPNIDGDVAMLAEFRDWFGTKPGWVSVEWR